MIEDVREAITDLVDLMKTYQSKNNLSKVLTSSVFKRRLNEAEAVVAQALPLLQVCVSDSLLWIGSAKSHSFAA